MELNINEALRYLGIQVAPDDTLLTQLTLLSNELQSRIKPRFVWRAFSLTPDSEFQIPNSELVKRVLGESGQAAILVCTLGAEFDLWMKRLQARDMSQAVMLDALGSVYVEAGCDAVQSDIRARFPGMFLTDRFSPGYGDFPLTAQPSLMAYAGAGRIGVTITDALLMIPQKSVTAIVGISDQPQPARIRGCTYCAMNKTCPYRKVGTTCHV